jgi:hypothetical protein
LAVARSNHQIELWKASSFTQLLIVPGNKNADIRSLHWLESKFTPTNGPESNIMYYNRMKDNKQDQKERRLVTTGLNGMVIEWDLQS